MHFQRVECTTDNVQSRTLYNNTRHSAHTHIHLYNGSLERGENEKDRRIRWRKKNNKDGKFREKNILGIE